MCRKKCGVKILNLIDGWYKYVCGKKYIKDVNRLTYKTIINITVNLSEKGLQIV